MDKELKDRAVALRIRGYSIKEISMKMNIARSTASSWLKGVVLSEKARDRLFKKIKTARLKAAKTNQNKRLDRIGKIEATVKCEFVDIDIPQGFGKILCSMIYYCEGAKDDGAVYFTNSDPLLLQLFLRLMRQFFKLDESKFKVIVHLHEYHDWEIQKKYWSEILKIDEKYFYKPYLKKNTGKNKKAGYPGCVSLRYYDSNVSRELLAIAKYYLHKMGGSYSG